MDLTDLRTRLQGDPRVVVGKRFAMDSEEPENVARLLRQVPMIGWYGSEEDLAFLQAAGQAYVLSNLSPEFDIHVRPQVVVIEGLTLAPERLRQIARSTVSRGGVLVVPGHHGLYRKALKGFKGAIRWYLPPWRWTGETSLLRSLSLRALHELGWSHEQLKQYRRHA
jgi:hypothetical protein